MIQSEEKILDRTELAARVEELREADVKIVFTNGCFDLIHVGHLRYLQAARRAGDVLIVAVNSDASMRRIKGPGRPLLPAGQRKRLLGAFSCVDFVTEFEEDTPHGLLTELRPDVLVKGANYGLDGVVGREIVEGYGGEVRTLALSEGQSTSLLIRRAGSESTTRDP